MTNRCLFCGGDASEPDHLAHCDGRQGKREPDFDGETYDHQRDHGRLVAQLGRVWAAVNDEQWHTPPELVAMCGDEWASISARIRDLRKQKFGGHVIERRYLHDGLWEYRLLKKQTA